MSIEDIATGQAGKRSIVVAAESKARSVAGAIFQCIKIGGFPPAVLAKGVAATNQAIKAIAIARTYLSLDEDGEDSDLIAQPSFFGDSEGCIVHVRNAKPIELDTSDPTLTVSGKSDPYNVAGAIAGHIRDGTKRVSLVACGPLAVFHAVESIAVTRSYLRNEGIDVKFVPQFSQLEIEGRGEMQVMFFAIMTRRE